MTLHLTAGQRAWLKTELELRQQQLSGLIERHHLGASRVEHAPALPPDAEEATPQPAKDPQVDLGLAVPLPTYRARDQ